MTADLGDTIIALATPPGRSAIAVLRASGRECLSFLRAACRPSLDWKSDPRRLRLVRLVNESGGEIDRCLAAFFPAPHSYTGQDVAEISCHGSTWVCRSILNRALQCGLRLAGPGEFTQRAFLLGKMDLLQAEGVRDLIESETAFQARVAREQLEGNLSRRLRPVKEEIVSVISHMETALEFVDEEVDPEGRGRLARRLGGAIGELVDLEESFRVGRLVQDGIKIAIAGRPNVGKSSLFNALMSEDRVIVTDIPGTTRDAVSERFNLRGIPAELVDTAGIRETADAVERLGVERSLRFLGESDVALFVVDGSRPFSEEDRRTWDALREARPVLVVNKSDLSRRVEIPQAVAEGCRERVDVSATEGTNLEGLREAVFRAAGGGEGFEREGALLTSVRQQRHARECLEALREGLRAYRSGVSEEYVLDSLRRALQAMGRLTGEVTVEDILGEIFSTFCIGK